jgi:bifunctional N-acetylglucosamine-1-phosphate-uridyltransferase/glucosamine-1-phosphate-acetyltransferase GlmU-like protein
MIPVPHDIEVARLLNRTWDSKTGRLLLTFEITDPAMKQRIMRQDLTVKLVVEEDDQCQSTNTNVQSADTGLRSGEK